MKVPLTPISTSERASARCYQTLLQLIVTIKKDFLGIPTAAHSQRQRHPSKIRHIFSQEQ
jgi:hypothetical protein